MWTCTRSGPTPAASPMVSIRSDNCGTTYFSIQFKRRESTAGFGDYAEGFSATRVGGEAQAKLPRLPGA